MTIAVSSDDLTEGTVSPASLTFTPANWDAPQTVTVTGVDDATADGPVAYHVLLATSSADTAYDGLHPGEVTVINLDNETRFTVVPIGGLTTTEAGGTAAFTVQLNSAPTADVTIGLSSSDPTEGTVSPSALTFTTANWNEPQTVTVTGVDDFAVDGDVAYNIVTAPAVSSDASYNGQNPPDVSAVNLDDDVASVNLSATSLSPVEGQTATYSVTLTSQPAADVIVTPVSSDTAQGGTISPSSLTFTAANWNTPQTVTVTASDDLAADGNTAWTITNSVTSSDVHYAALPPVEVSATTLDNEATVTLPSGRAVYGLGMPGVGIDSRALIADPNTPDENGATLTVEVISNGAAADMLEIRNTGTDSGQIGVSGGNVSYAGTTIGGFAGGGGPTPLVVTFNPAATPAAVQAVLRNVTFRTSGTNEAARTVAVTLVHADGGTARAATGIHVGQLRLADFQDGADGGYGVYSGQADIELDQSLGDLPFPSGSSGSGSDPRLWLDSRDNASAQNETQVLMRFDNLIGDQAGQIPANAIIVSAELILNVEDQGDGSPLFRMLMPWDENGATWDSLGGGIHPDGVTASTNYESQIGVMEVSGSTGIGQITVGVTADVQAWANGEANYGWGLTSWDQDLNANWSRGTDGLGFSPSESPDVDRRPRLRVLWLPGGTVAASFRQGVGDYTGAHDTRIREDSPDSEASTLASIGVDFSGSHDESLFRFDNIVGYDTNQIPPGAHIEAATLDLATLGSNAYGDGGQFFAMLTPWQDTDTWNSVGGGIRTDDVQAASQPTASAGAPSLDPNVCGGYMSFDVTPDVQRWSDGAANYGWAVLPWLNGSDGWFISTAEAAAESDRPRLRVFYTYTPPPVALVLSTNQLNIIEGQTAVYTVALNAKPAANVVVNVLAGDTAHGGTVSPASLTFTPGNWNTPQPVTVTAADDLVPNGNVSWSITNVDDTIPSMEISVNTLDNEALLTLPAGGAVYGLGMPAVGIDGGATLADPNTAGYNGTTLTVALSANGTTDDRLEIRDTGTGSGQIGVSGGTVSFGGLAIGTFTGGSGATPLIVTFNGSATPDAAQALLRNVTFRNVSAGIPSLATRTVTVTLAHPDGGASSALTRVRVGMVRAADFQEGADGGYGVYTGEADIQLSEANPDTAYPAGSSGTAASPGMWVDARSAATTPEEQQALLRFDNLIGDGPGQIPTNAVIVSANLILNVVDTGHGSPLFRMLQPWDATNETWNSLGGGIHPDGIVAETNWDSQIGETAAAGTTGSGQITVGVTADVQAWADGQPNYGWGLTSWDADLNASWNRGANGMAFNPGETPDVRLRPRLQVLWVTNGTAVASFRQGVNGYTNAVDTRIRERSTSGDNTNDFSAVPAFFVDWAVSSGGENDEQVLLRFDRLIGTNADQIPPGAHIEYAALDFATVIQNACGDGGQFYALREPWQDTDSWVSLNGGIQPDGIRAAADPTVTAGSAARDPNVCGGYLAFDVTADLQNWANGTTNFGWAILPWDNGGDGWGISSAEAAAERDRPRLRVYYDTSVASPASIVLKAPVITPGSAEIQFTGSSGSYTVWRAANAAGPWSHVGIVTVGADGQGTYTDNAPLKNQAFYRVSNP